MPYVASTLAADTNYTRWVSNPGGVNVNKGAVTIKGGHGVAQKTSNGGLQTPNGVVTKVSQDDLDFLMKDEVFKTHLKVGAVRVLNSNVAPEKAARDMNTNNSGPLTSKDFERGGRAAMPENMKVNGGKALQ